MSQNTFDLYRKIIKRIDKHLSLVCGCDSEFKLCFIDCFSEFDDGTIKYPQLHKTYYYLAKPFTTLQAIQHGCTSLRIEEVRLNGDEFPAPISNEISIGLISNLLEQQGRDPNARIYRYVLSNKHSSDILEHYAEFNVCYFVYKDGEDKCTRNKIRASRLEIMDAIGSRPLPENNKKKGWL